MAHMDGINLLLKALKDDMDLQANEIARLQSHLRRLQSDHAVLEGRHEAQVKKIRDLEEESRKHAAYVRQLCQVGVQTRLEMLEMVRQLGYKEEEEEEASCMPLYPPQLLRQDAEINECCHL